MFLTSPPKIQLSIFPTSPPKSPSPRGDGDFKSLLPRDKSLWNDVTSPLLLREKGQGDEVEKIEAGRTSLEWGFILFN